MSIDRPHIRFYLWIRLTRRLHGVVHRRLGIIGALHISVNRLAYWGSITKTLFSLGAPGNPGGGGVAQTAVSLMTRDPAICAEIDGNRFPLARVII
jgi:hypothetical protein